MRISYAQRRIRRSSGLSTDSGSSRFSLQRCKLFFRKSLRVIGKLAVNVKQRIRTSIRKHHERDDELYAGPVPFLTKLTLGQYKRSVRKSEACIFQHKYIYDGSIDKRVYINSSGDTCSWIDRSVRCMWVAVHGMKTMCVAFRGTLDPARYPGFSPNMFRRLFSLNVISEIEDIALSTSDSHQTLDEHVTKPFGVVSVIQSTTDVQESGDEVCVLDRESEYPLLRDELEEHLAVIDKQPLQTEEINEPHLSVINKAYE